MIKFNTYIIEYQSDINIFLMSYREIMKILYI